jgi:hypothetical protein
MRHGYAHRLCRGQARSFRLFKPGTFTSVEGKKITFSEADVRQIAESYDPAADPAPLVVGHPKLEDPAFGWAKGLEIVDGELAAVPERVSPAFAEAVNEGRYARVSAQFYEPEHPPIPAGQLVPQAYRLPGRRRPGR